MCSEGPFQLVAVGIPWLPCFNVVMLQSFLVWHYIPLHMSLVAASFTLHPSPTLPFFLYVYYSDSCPWVRTCPVILNDGSDSFKLYEHISFLQIKFTVQ